MVVNVVINAQRTMIHTLSINVAWCCGKPVSCVLRHFATSTLLHCPMPTVRPFPLLAGRVPRLPWLPRWPPFPQGPHTLPLHRPLQLAYMFIAATEIGGHDIESRRCIQYFTLDTLPLWENVYVRKFQRLNSSLAAEILANKDITSSH